ncbi:MAG: hydantoinase B/oxoprolinase family protein [Gammaproteobacteria bacterium]|nr:MAG: hydantoinase B/oxoprolinase family protein [Gammaproteobacteria bacterium]
MNPVELSLFSHRLATICEEMGAVLKRTAISPNIRDRLDYSCAVFDPAGALVAQAAHIPVHLGSMAFAMRGIVSGLEWRPGDMVVVNDPYLGGTHLPDVTLIAPLHVEGTLVAFVANRAHHADIGGGTPGSMPLSRTLEEEGVIIPPSHLIREGSECTGVWDRLLGRLRDPAGARGDFRAQIGANRNGLGRLSPLIGAMGIDAWLRACDALNDYGEAIARATLSRIPQGDYRFSDCMDDDGQGRQDIPIVVEMRVADGEVRLDFSASASQVPGNINCPLPVTAAAAFYVFRCLMPGEAPSCAGLFRPLHLTVPEGTLLNALPPAAVAAGNVETSSRVVDVVLGALLQALPEAIPAASQGTMNNLAMGGRDWGYYETMGGGMGAGPRYRGLDAVQSHMTNTLNTPVEVLERHLPVLVTRYAVRRGSGGRGRRRGGDGLIREFRFLQPATVTLLTERRRHPPWGAAGGGDGLPGRNLINGGEVPGKVTLEAREGDLLRIETPGGGGWGRK